MVNYTELNYHLVNLCCETNKPPSKRVLKPWLLNAIEDFRHENLKPIPAPVRKGDPEFVDLPLDQLMENFQIQLNVAASKYINGKAVSFTDLKKSLALIICDYRHQQAELTVKLDEAYINGYDEGTMWVREMLKNNRGNMDPYPIKHHF